jgi:hypothetical protein
MSRTRIRTRHVRPSFNLDPDVPAIVQRNGIASPHNCCRALEAHQRGAIRLVHHLIRSCVVVSLLVPLNRKAVIAYSEADIAYSEADIAYSEADIAFSEHETGTKSAGAQRVQRDKECAHACTAYELEISPTFQITCASASTTSKPGR